VCALGNAIVWCRYAGGGGTAITLGAVRGRAAAGDALAGLAALGELVGCGLLPVGPVEQPAISNAATTAAARARRRRPRPGFPGRTWRGWRASRLGMAVNLASLADRQALFKLS
jgi:hypothetical protein